MRCNAFVEAWKNYHRRASMILGLSLLAAPLSYAVYAEDGVSNTMVQVVTQTKTVKGTIIDESGEPLIGVSIVVKGTSTGTITDFNGNFSIDLPAGRKELVISYIGYKEQTVTVTGNGPVNVKMVSDTQALDEVVVVGYGAERKSLMAGAVSGLKVNHKKDIQYEEEASMALDVEQSQGQMGYEFEIKVPYTIPSDNKPVVAEIGHYELPASYTYQSTPKIDKDAFLIAQVTDWEKLNLLEGEANVYFENTFIGKSIMNVTQQNDTLSFSLGRDKRIMIQRTKENEYTSRKFMGSNQTQSIAWKLSIRNTRPEPVTLTLYDQLPVSRNNNITVTAEEISGGSLDEAKGIITWQITLQPGEQRDLALRYKVKYPKGRNLIIE